MPGRMQCQYWLCES